MSVFLLSILLLLSACAAETPVSDALSPALSRSDARVADLLFRRGLSESVSCRMRSDGSVALYVDSDTQPRRRGRLFEALSRSGVRVDRSTCPLR